MAKLVKLWTALQTSYWFIPSVMSLGAAILSFLLAAADGVAIAVFERLRRLTGELLKAVVD